MSVLSDVICKKLESSFDEYLNELKSVTKLATTKINELKNFIAKMTFSPGDLLNEAVDNVRNSIGSIVPKMDAEEDIDEMIDIINACVFLKNDSGLNNPITLARSISNQAISNAARLIKSIGNALPEFSAANLINDIIDLYGPKGINLKKLIPNLYQILECIDTICGIDMSGKIAEMNRQVNKLFVLTNGEFDRFSFYLDINLDPDQILNLEPAVDAVSNVRNEIDSAIDQGISRAKSMLSF